MGFSIVQHSRDLLLFNAIKELLGIGSILEEKNKNVVRFRVDRFFIICEHIIPFLAIMYCKVVKVKTI